MNAIEFLNTHFCEHALPRTLPPQNFLTDSVKRTAKHDDKSYAKAVKNRLKDLGYLPTDKGYERIIHGIDLCNMVFNSSLPLQEQNDTGEWVSSSPKRLSPKGGCDYLIVTETGYHSRYRLASNLGKHVNNCKQLMKFKPITEGAIYQFIKQWGQEPFLLLDLGNTTYDFNRIRFSLDLRYIVFNHPDKNFVRDFSNYI